MNTDAYYEPRRPQVTREDPDTAMTQVELSALGHRQDPSLAGRLTPPRLSPRDRSIAWVRPSELVATDPTALLRLGDGPRAELLRARRAPATTAGPDRPITRPAIDRPEEGLGL